MHYHSAQSNQHQATAKDAHEQWPIHGAPPPPPLPDEGPTPFGMARPARLLGIAWALSVPAVLWSHVKFDNPITIAIVGASIGVALLAGVIISWIAFRALNRSRAAASGIFGGLASIGLAANILFGVFTTLAADALREVNQRPTGLQAQLGQELLQAKIIAANELARARKEGFSGVLKHIDPAPAPVVAVLATPAPAPAPSAPVDQTLAANGTAQVSSPSAVVAAAAPKAETVVTPRAPKPKPQLVVPPRGVSVRMPGTAPAKPVVQPLNPDTMERLALQAFGQAQERIDRATRRYAESAIALSQLRDPLLYAREVEFTEFRRALDEHYLHAAALREAYAQAPAVMRNRLSLAGVPSIQIDPAVNAAFTIQAVCAGVEFRDAYLDWLAAREARAMVLESSLGRWKYNAANQQLWMADDWVRTACEGAFDVLRASNQTLAAKREQAEMFGIPTRLQDMTQGESRLANEDEGG